MRNNGDATLDGCTEVLFKEYVAEHRVWGPLEWKEE